MVRRRGSAIGRDYWRLWCASALSNLGDGIRAAAFPLLVAFLTRDPAAVAGLSVALHLPWLVGGLPAGVVVDRVDRRRLWTWINAGRAAALGLLLLALATGRLDVWGLYALAFLLGAGEILVDGATLAMVPRVVPAAVLERANGRLLAAEIAGNEFAGPPLGAALFSVAVILPFATNAGALAVAVMLVLSLPAVFVPVRTAPRTRVGTDVGEGLRWLLRHRAVRTVTGVAAVWNLVDTAWFAILVLYAGDVLGVGELAFGILLAVGAVGGILGALLAPRLSRSIGWRGVLVWVLVLAAGAQLVLGVTSDVVVAGAMLALSSMSFGLGNVVVRTMRQSLVPDELLGRVNSAYRTLAYGGAVLGSVLGGLLATQLGLRAPLLGGVPVLLVTALAAHGALRE